ncbi:MAG: 2Fe-2S iron-sulfur cluster-binding protein [Niabella sp.]
MTAGEKIGFTVVEYGNSREIEACENEYRNLMVLINDQVYPEGFGECGGQGRCATCMVRIEGGDVSLLSERHRNEESTLGKKGACSANVRLSCQIMINSLLNGATVYIEE